MTCTEITFCKFSCHTTIFCSKTVPKYLSGHLHSVIQHCLELISKNTPLSGEDIVPAKCNNGLFNVICNGKCSQALVKWILAGHRTPFLFVPRVDQLCKHIPTVLRLTVLRLLPELNIAHYVRYGK